MTLSSRLANKFIDAANVMFGVIGNDTTTKMPRSKDNRAPYAWEYFVSKHLLKMAEARHGAAIKAAVRAGVIFDHHKEPREAGRLDVLYQDENVIVKLRTSQGNTRIDPDALAQFLIKRGVEMELIEAAADAATKQFNAKHEFIVSLNVEDRNGK